MKQPAPATCPGVEVVVADVGEAARGQALQHLLRVGPLHRDQADVGGDVLEPDVGAALLLDDVLPRRRDVGRVHDDHELVVEAVDGAVVDEGALPRQQPRVLHAARLEHRDVVAGDAVDEGVPVGTGDLELAHVRHVEDADVAAHGVVLGEDARRGTAPASPSRRTGRSWRRGAGGCRRAACAGGRSWSRVWIVDGWAGQPMSIAISAFCACSRFSASSKTRDCGPSSTCSVTSSPRCAGRQCRKIARGCGLRHEALVHHEAGERLGAQLLLGLLAHRGPDVGGDDVGARSRPRAASGSRGSSRARATREQLRARLVALRAREAQLEAEHRPPPRSSCCAMLLPSPIQATVRPPSVAELLVHRQQVGQDLAGMVVVGEAVDDRHRGEPRQLLDVGVVEGADHDAVDVAREHARGVADRLAAAELDVARRQEEGVPAELRGTRPRTRRGSGWSSW